MTKPELKPKSILLPVFVTVFLDLLGVGIIIPIMAPVFLDTNYSLLPSETSLHMRTIILGLLIATFPIAQFFGAPLLGALADRKGRRKILLFSLAGTCLGYILFAVALMEKNLWLLFVSRALDGFTGGNISIVTSAIADVSDEKTRTKNFGLIGLAFALGFTIGPYIGGSLSDSHHVSWFNYSTPFIASAALSFLNIILVLIRFPETSTVRVQRPISAFTGFRNIAKVFQLKNMRVMFSVIFFLTFGFSFFTQFFQVFLIQKFSFSTFEIGNLFAYIGIWIAVSQGGIARPLAKKFSPSQILNIAIVLLGITFLILLMPDHRYLLYYILPFVAVFQGLIQPNSTNIISTLTAKDSQGEIMGIQQSVQSLAMAIPPIIAGFIVNIDLNLPIFVAALSTILAGIIFIYGFHRSNRLLFKQA
jgi:DHA1 family tetracycline resistance protein-like MFS transporter